MGAHLTEGCLMKIAVSGWDIYFSHPEEGNGYRVFVPPMSDTIQDLRHRIVEAVNSITRDHVIRVWQEMCHRFDICRVTNGVHIECIKS
ncbi:hypothetical protein J437_LFUL006586 [Ladona fulva]|uniref:Uncharacterized protein n=1 Tax=Ladona fulva TaxID=123851 RepID=A0A8K0K205_LADFU|nr:hypothetical protein J437_LFUL006586 [Ladona fulva]